MHSVIVTGASRGLGLAIARRLSKAGYRVVAIARRESDELREAMSVAETESHGPIAFEPFDLGEIEAIPDLVRDLRRRHGSTYGLVNNAGIGTEGLLAVMHNSDIEKLLRLNSLSPIIMTKYVVRHMMADGGGRIVNMSSIIASTGFNALSVYAATKASLVGFTRSLAREVGGLGITVNAIAPGFIATDLTSGLDEAGRAKIAGRSALKRLAEPGDVAGAVEFLMGEGGRNITGTVLTVDGGNTA